MAFDAASIKSARLHLRRGDAVMKGIIDHIGPFTLRADKDRFGMLVRSIISQQISTGAARAIRGRLDQLVAPAKVTPQTLLRLETEQLRAVGLSSQKVGYLRDLASKADDGSLRLQTIGRLPDERVIERLTEVKGIGRWTAHMFLIFALGRIDVFPEDDLGVRVAIRDRYGLDDLPDKVTSREIAQPWRPFATVASWYCWRSLEAAKNGAAFPVHSRKSENIFAPGTSTRQQE